MDPKPEAPGPSSENGGGPRRLIKRYSNRKLYDTKGSRYVTLLQVGEIVREGEEVQIIDNNTKDDLTEVTLAQIIYEEQKSHARNVPLQTLRELIHNRTERVLADLREGPIGRLIPGPRPGDEKVVEPPPGKDGKPTLVDQAKEKFEGMHHLLDARITSILSSFRPLQQLQLEVKHLNERIDQLERKVQAKNEPEG